MIEKGEVMGPVCMNRYQDRESQLYVRKLTMARIASMVQNIASLPSHGSVSVCRWDRPMLLAIRSLTATLDAGYSNLRGSAWVS